jgi:hypothetical protein
MVMLKPSNFGWLMMLVGGCLIWYGVLEQQAGGDASAVAVDVDLGDLEAGKALPGNHIKIGLHHCLYNASVFEYEDGSGKPTSSSELVWLYSPIISDGHPYMKGLRELEKTHGDLGNVPREAKWPRLENFAVLVKSEAYKTIGEAPKKRKYYESVSGLVINRIESLGDEEKALIRESFPNIDFEKILILEHGREPTSLGGVVAWIGAGALLVLIPILAGIRGMRSKPVHPPAAADAVSEWKVDGRSAEPDPDNN